MFEDYQALVLRTYVKMKEEGSLALSLSFPTPSKIKTECIIACESRFLKTDEKILIDFFGRQDDLQTYRQIIRHFDRDKFRPLCHFLRGETSGILEKEKNIELLAWLMDFQYRPYIPGKKYQHLNDAIQQPTPGNVQNSNQEEINTFPAEDISRISDGTELLSKPEINILKKDDPLFIDPLLALSKLQRKFTAVSARWTVSFFGVFVLLCGSIYFLPSEKCMYWNKDHYEPVSCNRQSGDLRTYALDQQKAEHFEKITQPDTITKNSLGKVWYSKIDGKVEFFTADGFHPVHIDRRLKPLTDYMLRKYVYNRR